MQFKSQSLAKALLVLSVVIGLTSGYLGREWTAKRQGMESSVKKMDKQLQDALAAQKSLNSVLKNDEGAELITLDKAVSQVMLEIFNKRVEHGISIAFATPAKLSTGGNVTKLDVLADTTPGTKVKSVRINLNGTYQTYQGLLNYLKALQGMPVSIVRLKVQDQSFEAAIRVYGNES